MNLSNNIYSLVALDQGGYSSNNWGGIILLSSGFSFVYTLNSSSVGTVCSSNTTSLTSCTNNLTCTLENCKTCDINKTSCTNCIDGYAIFNGVCYLIKNCQVNNCNICDDS